MSLKAKLLDDLKAAMKAKESDKTRVFTVDKSKNS